jgi:hypothetical protein
MVESVIIIDLHDAKETARPDSSASIPGEISGPGRVNLPPAPGTPQASEMNQHAGAVDGRVEAAVMLSSPWSPRLQQMSLTRVRLSLKSIASRRQLLGNRLHYAAGPISPEPKFQAEAGDSFYCRARMLPLILQYSAALPARIPQTLATP